MRFAVPAVASLLLLASAGASPSPEEPVVFRHEVDIVKVTVTVRDEKGHLVTDLKPEEFVILEDGEPQTIELCANAGEESSDEKREKALTLDLGLLMDTSSSMQPVLKLSQQAAIRFLEGVPRARDLLTLFFDRDIRISRYDSEHQQGLFERILASRGAENTAFYDALTVYLSRAEESTGRRVAVLFTDGEDTASKVRFSELVDMVRASPVTIYVIGFHPAAPTHVRTMTSAAVLRKLADITGGNVYFPANYRDLPGIYERILADLGAQYVLGFQSRNKTADGKFRKLKVMVKRPGMRIVHREGYYAPDPPAAAKADPAGAPGTPATPPPY